MRLPTKFPTPYWDLPYHLILELHGELPYSYKYIESRLAPKIPMAAPGTTPSPS